MATAATLQPDSSSRADELAPVLTLVGRGWRLFPCLPRSKKPYIKDWPALATTNPAQLQTWARDYPGCNWALATGPGSGVWALDCDVKPCPSCSPEVRRVDGKNTLRGLIAEHGLLPRTLTTVTQHGGQYLFRYPSGRQIRNDNSGKKLGEGLDIRGHGGYVMVPPSTHPEGAAYRFADAGTAVADAPEWLLRMVESPTPTSTSTAPVSSTSTGIGQRHNRLTHVIGRMLRDDMASAVIEAAVLAENATFAPPKPEKDVRKLVADMVERYAKGDGAPPSAPRRADLLTLSEVTPRDVDWLWRPYLPAGMLAMLSGDPGAGKTYLALAIASALTTGHVPCSRECSPLR
jgi:putative DNA primase/helicase